MKKPSSEFNPYEAPTYSGPSRKPSDRPPRKAARLTLRLALIIFLFPAIYNYYCFDAAVLGSEEFPVESFSIVSRIINIGGIVLASCLLWLFSLPILELITSLIFHVFSRNSKADDWLAALYDVLRPVVYFAVAGALLWMIWNVGYYDLNIDFYAISIPVGVLAHVLAAGLYLRLAYRWYQIERAARAATHQ